MEAYFVAQKLMAPMMVDVKYYHREMTTGIIYRLTAILAVNPCCSLKFTVDWGDFHGHGK